MEIKFPQQVNLNKPSVKSIQHYYNKSISNDIFVNSGKKQTQVSFSGNIFSRLFKQKEVTTPEFVKYGIPSQYISEVTMGLNNLTGSDFPAQNLSCLMTPKEFLSILPSLQPENFLSNEKNIASGIYCADLDYQTSFSDGDENVFDILNKVSVFANEYNKRTGKKFIFALTDRDSIEGLQHAIRIIASNPKKFENVKFIPGIKMSFSHKAPASNLGYESSDMLVYGINPFSENLIDYIDTTIRKRKSMTVDFIKKVNKLYPEFAYSVLEFAKQNRIKYKKDFAVSNLYQRAREYAETKGDTEIKGISMVPKEVLEEAEEILSELDKVYLGSSEKGYSALGSQIIKDDEVNKSIKKVFDEYSTHFDPVKGKVVSSDGNLYEDMIECLSKEPEQPILALCDPYYFSHYFTGANKINQAIEFFNKLIANSKGMLVAFESVSPKYNQDKLLTADEIRTFNNLLREETNLYEVGGSFAQVLK